MPHHIVQRGVRRQDVFFRDDDYRYFLNTLKASCKAYAVEVWTYCLMPNHVHLIVVPSSEGGLSLAMADVFERYARFVNSRSGCSGRLWQDRYNSSVLDDEHLEHAVRYVELNPVAAHIVSEAWDYPWSSAQSHVSGVSDGIVDPNRLTQGRSDWCAYLGSPQDSFMLSRIRDSIRTGRPSASDAFCEALEERLGRVVRRQKRGPKPRVRAPSLVLDEESSVGPN